MLVNVVVAVLMKHLEESNKEAQLEEMEERKEREEMREREERREREEKREREEANRRLSTASVGGDMGQSMETPAQVTDRVCVCAYVKGKGFKVTTMMTAVMISCGRCSLRMRSVPMATC